jgi:hypothetical protein
LEEIEMSKATTKVYPEYDAFLKVGKEALKIEEAKATIGWTSEKDVLAAGGEAFGTNYDLKDMEGNKIADIEPGKAKGINIVGWGYTRKMPKVAKGKTFSFGGFTSPRVPAGTYKAVITKGKDTFEHTFELVYEDNGIPLEAREAKDRTTMELYDMTQQLAYLVYQVDAFLEQAEKAGDTRELRKLNALKETLVVTTGDNYVGLADPQLREKMADLYSKVAGSYDAPSAADMDNLRLIRERFAKARAEFDALKPRVKGGDTLSLVSFGEFLEMD